MSLDSSYKTLPAAEEDLDELLDMGEKAFADDPLSQALFGLLESDESRALMRQSRKERQLRYSRGERHGEQTMLFEPHYAKVVFVPKESPTVQEQTVALCGWHAPAQTESPEQVQERSAGENMPPDLQRVIDRYKEIDKIITAKSDEVIGSGRERQTKYWYLASLFTHPDHQRKGLGSRLVQWGVERAKADAVKRPEQIKGVWTVATPAGLRTYLNAGMKPVGKVTVDYGKGLGENGQTFVWLLQKFNEDK